MKRKRFRECREQLYFCDLVEILLNEFPWKPEDSRNVADYSKNANKHLPKICRWLYKCILRLHKYLQSTSLSVKVLTRPNPSTMNLKLSSSPISIFLKEENSWKTYQVGSKRNPHITVRFKKISICVFTTSETDNHYVWFANKLEILELLVTFISSECTFLNWSVHECNTSALSLTLKFKSVLSMQISHFYDG